MAGSVGCDQGVQRDESEVGAPVQIVGGANSTLAPGQPIELAFDRLLMPLSILRQTFVLEDLRGNGLAPPNVAYDPVARVVTLTTEDLLPAGQAYRLIILTPAGPSDPNGLRAIDGATLDPMWTAPLTFPVLGAAVSPAAPNVDFCSIIQPIFVQHCAGGGCHDGPTPPPAEGLWLTSPAGVLNTALRLTAHGSNTGPVSGVGQAPQPPPLFGIDMPIIDPNAGAASGGDPGNSWLIYKLLLATPSAGPTLATHAVPWKPISDRERATLSNYVLGREMPFPPNPASASVGLSVDQLEQISNWIAEGASVSACL